MPARVKLKGIDGGPHKRWSMWFNSMIRDYCLLPAGLFIGAGYSDGTAGDKPEEGGDDVKSSWPLCPGLHTCYNGRYRALRDGDVKQIAKSRP